MDRSQESEAMQHKQLEAVKEAMGLEITALHRAIEGMTAHHDAEKKPWSDSVLRVRFLFIIFLACKMVLAYWLSHIIVDAYLVMWVSHTVL